jgi:hypothetical protein
MRPRLIAGNAARVLRKRELLQRRKSFVRNYLDQGGRIFGMTDSAGDVAGAPQLASELQHTVAARG